MKILCVTPWFPAHDDEKEGNFVRDSVESLRELGHEVEVLVTRPWRPWPLTVPAGRSGSDHGRIGVHHMKYLSIPHNRLRWLSNHLYRWRVASAMETLAQSSRADVIHVHTELPAVTAVKVARRIGIPCAVTLHGINPAARLNTPAQHALLRRTLREASRVVLVGQPLRPFFGPIIRRTDHFRVVPNGFRPPVAVPPPRARWSDPLQFVSVSNLHEGKGIELNLQALARMRAEGLDRWNYRIVGGGGLRTELEQLAMHLGLSAQVTFVGPVGHQEVYRQLNASDVFILPSYREAFGIAYLEAMACGLLTLGVRNQGPAAFISHGETGLLVAPRDAADLAAQLATVLREPQRMLDIARHGQQHVCSEFTWKRHAEQLASVLAEAVEEQQCRTTGR